MRDRPIYLDYHATSPTDPRVVEAMLPYFTTRFGNPSSLSHAYGWETADAIDDARELVARLLNANSSHEIIFTSSATEANNLALKGGADSLARKGDHIVTSAIEHRAVLDPLKRLARSGSWTLSLADPRPDGTIDPDSVQEAITDRTVLVSVMLANNETGVINPIREIAQICRQRRVTLHVDASQAVGKIRIDVQELDVDLLSLSGHKFCGPKGIGALYKRHGSVRLHPLLDGGGQERGLRSGTSAVPLIIGLGAAAEIARLEMEAEGCRVSSLRDSLAAMLSQRLGPSRIRVNGADAPRLPGSLNITFLGLDGEALLMRLREVAVSSGAACSSSDPEPSRVLRLMGATEQEARASLRFGLGRFTTADEVADAAEIVAREVAQLAESPARDDPANRDEPCGSPPAA